MIRNLFSSIVIWTKNFFTAIKGAPSFIKSKINDCVGAFNDFKYSVNNIASSNMELGIYHLYKRNYRDAIFRFKLIEKFLDPNNKKANYFLGWIYFLKNDYKNSIIQLTKAGTEDKIGLFSFVKSIDTAKIVPSKIYQMHRDIVAEAFIARFITKTEDIPKRFILNLNKEIKELPEEYSILELGGNVGLLGHELKKRMQESFSLSSVEISESMIKLQPVYFPNTKLYDEIFNESVDHFLKKKSKKYNIICSLNGFAFESDLTNIFNDIFLSLESSGYFAFLIKISQNNELSSNSLEFSYQDQKLLDQLVTAGFIILSHEQFSLEIKNNYSMFVCTK